MKKVAICLSLVIFIFVNSTICLAEQTGLSKFLIEPTTGKVLEAENENELRPIASITKIMTLLIAFEKIEEGALSLEQKITISDYAASMGGSQVLLAPGEQISVAGLLESIVIASANDSCVAIGETIGGGNITNFVQMMNERAKELGMKDTHFENSTGLPADNPAYSTAHDVAIMGAELIKHDLFFKWSTTWDKYMEECENKTQMTNTNRLTQYYTGCDGIKTGSTNEAGFCLAATAKRGNMRLISVILGAPSAKERFDYSEELLDYGFENYRFETIIEKGMVMMQDIPVEKGMEDYLNVLAGESVDFIQGIAEQPNYKKEVLLNRPLIAPIQEGETVGKVTVTDGSGILIGEIPLITDRAIEKATFWYNVKKIIGDWF